MVHELHRREDSLCDGCGPYTSIKSFRGASKTLTRKCDEYPKARRTVITSKKKRVFTTESRFDRICLYRDHALTADHCFTVQPRSDCKTTTFKKVQQTMYVLWVRQEGFANAGGASSSQQVIRSLPLLFLSLLVGSLFVLLR